jgi:CRISPR-associated protein Csd1
MSWIQKLYETYENCQAMIGVGSDVDVNEAVLLPICHTTQKAQIEIVIDQDGNFKRARVVPKDKARTIVPCTEASGSRSGSKPVPHPLCDKLQYVAKDFVGFGGQVTSGYAKNPHEPHDIYRDLLTKWCESEFCHPKAKIVLKYVEKGNVIKDLVDFGILFIGSNRKLLKKWDKKAGNDIPDIFRVSANSTQQDAFVRWVIEIPNDPQASVWTDVGLFDSWIKYYTSTKENKTLCYVTGKELFIADQHPAKLRNDGDKAKLISSNDISGFTFRGRFLTDKQACTVGFEVTQKAHCALRWLISRQAYRRGEQTIVAWATSGGDIPDPLADPFTMLGFDELQSDSDYSNSTAQELALKLKKKIAGYSANLGDTTNIVVMGLDSATTGRMAITFYRELTGSDFLQRIEYWHRSCAWIHNYRQKEVVDKDGKKKKIYVKFVGAPAPSDIAEAAYGRRVDDKLRKATIERILPCIIDGQRIPRDLVESVVRRGSNRIGMEEWEWNKTLSIACALYRKYHEKEVYAMSLDENRKTRDYLYGRLLALADSLEQWALQKAGEKRQTTAARLMQRFADHPYTTWRTIELALTPYKARLGNISLKRQRLISEVIAMFEPEDFISDRKLSGEFLLGYHCQREALWKKETEEENGQ